MKRRFFDWNDGRGRDGEPPFLPLAVTELMDERIKEGRLDLSRTVVVFSARSGLHAFQKLLVRKARDYVVAGKITTDWRPPVMVTSGELPETLVPSSGRVANSLMERLLWRGALLSLQKEDPDGISRLFPKFPEKGDYLQELKIAGLLAGLHREMAVEGHQFNAPLKTSYPEKERWEILKRVQDRYFELLTQAGLIDPQMSRLHAIEEKKYQKERERFEAVYLLGVVDLNWVLRKILEQIADRVHLFVFAPEEKKDLFDEFGCVRPKEWKNLSFPIPDERIFPASNPVEEGRLAIERLLTLEESSPSDPHRFPNKTVIGIPDLKVVPFLSEESLRYGIPVRVGPGRPAKENRVFKLLTLIGKFLKGKSFDTFAELVRHPDFESYLRRTRPDLAQRGGWLNALDRIQNKYVPANVFRFSKEEEGSEEFRNVTEVVRELLSPLWEDSDPSQSGETAESATVPSGSGDSAAPKPFREVIRDSSSKVLPETKSLPLSEWPPLLSEVLEKIYPDMSREGDGTADVSDVAESQERETEGESRQIDAGLSVLYSLMDDVADIPDEWSPRLSDNEESRVFPDQVINILLNLGEGKRIPPERPVKAVDLAGWLDLIFDERPNLILTGMNEGVLPGSRSSEIFLTNSLRHQLRMEDNDFQYARDAYYLSAILTTRKVDFLFARRSTDGDPLLPSRFLLTGPPEEVAKRVLRFFGDAEEEETDKDASRGEISSGRDGAINDPTGLESSPIKSDKKTNAFQPPKLRMEGNPPTSMNVTEFSDFLTSPYCYFLKHSLKLSGLDDHYQELDMLSFGNIIHGVLERFGEDPKIRDSEDPDEIYRYLNRELDSQTRCYSRYRSAGTVLVQIEQIRYRLKSFAEWQSRWRGLGNEIRFVEIKSNFDCPLILEGEEFGPVSISGRIDRIDYHPGWDQWFVFDYKTFDNPKNRESKDSNPGGLDRLKFFTRMENNDDLLKLLNIKPTNEANEKSRSKKPGPKGFTMEEGAITDSLLRWTNLQLPLYRHLATKILREKIGTAPDENSIVTGFIVLSKKLETKAFAGNWTFTELEEADRTTEWAVKTIERLWRGGEIDPKALIDPDHPEWGKLLGDLNSSVAKNFAPLTYSDNQKRWK